MSLSRSTLKGLGLNQSQEDAIMEGHVDTVNGLKEKIDKLEAQAKQAQEEAKALASAKADLEKARNELEAQAKKLEESIQKQGTLEQQYKEEKAAFEKYKGDIQEEKALQAKKNAVTAVCKDLGFSKKGIDKILKYTDYHALELNGDGEIKAPAKFISTVKSEWGEYITETTEKGADIPTPPDKSGSYSSKADIFAIKDRGTRLKAISENLDLFQKNE